MLVLKINRHPEWIDVAAGVRLNVAPVTSAVMLAVMSDLARSGVSRDEPAEMQAALVKAIARRTILEWDGVGDADGAPIGVTPEGIDALLDLHRIFGAFNAKIVEPYLLVQSEKNASAPSPNGTSAGVETTATPASASAQSAQVN